MIISIFGPEPDWKLRAESAEKEVAKLYMQREAAQAEMSDLERENEALREEIKNALMHLDTNYDIDGNSMKDSDAAITLRVSLEVKP